MRTIAAVLVLASLLFAGCSKVQPLTEVSASLTTLPLPSGAAVVSPHPARRSKVAMPQPVCVHSPQAARTWTRSGAVAD